MQYKINKADELAQINWLTLPGLTSYTQAQALMEQTVEKLIDKQVSETVLLLEHEDVYTAGTNAKDNELLLDSARANLKEIPVLAVGRGGKYTYHGPGQRIIYPILDLAKTSRQKDIKLYVSNLELLVINVLKQLGIEAYSSEGRVGIWVNHQNRDAKIGAIGVRVKRWVTYHGIAINISTDLNKFSGIIPCGLENFPVTSLVELNVRISLPEFDEIVRREFCKIFV